ncbi:hypothetical protein TNCV_1390281 [Trichonephila clavipes]|nr:hypothetical protein TNCV_1390281 [Trichonephila clavipes]
MLVFVRGIDKNVCVSEEHLRMFHMKGQTTGNKLSSVLYLGDAVSLNMNNCISIATDGVKSRNSTKIRMVMLLKGRLVYCGVELVQHHCIIHQENLFGIELGFPTLMQCVSEATNFIRSFFLVLSKIDSKKNRD